MGVKRYKHILMDRRMEDSINAYRRCSACVSFAEAVRLLVRASLETNGFSVVNSSGKTAQCKGENIAGAGGQGVTP